MYGPFLSCSAGFLGTTVLVCLEAFPNTFIWSLGHPVCESLVTILVACPAGLLGYPVLHCLLLQLSSGFLDTSLCKILSQYLQRGSWVPSAYRVRSCNAHVTSWVASVCLLVLNMFSGFFGHSVCVGYCPCSLIGFLGYPGCVVSFHKVLFLAFSGVSWVPSLREVCS